MNRTFQTCATIGVICCLVIAACRKTDRVVSTPTPNDKSKLKQLFAPFRSTPQSFSVEAGTYAIVYGAEGTKLSFYPNSFKDAAGNIITSGTINIKLIEMYKPGAMIANGATTMTTDGKQLHSGGQVYLEVTKDGKEVFANKYGIGFRQPAASTQPMELYYGEANSADSMMEWVDGSSTAKPGTWATGTKEDTIYIMYLFDSCVKFQWVNCDHFYAFSGPRADIKIVMPDGNYNSTNSQVLLANHETATVSRCKGYSPYTYSFNFLPAGVDPIWSLKVGLLVDVVIITVINDEYYYFEKKDVTIADGISVKANMAKTSLTNIKEKLLTL